MKKILTCFIICLMVLGGTMNVGAEVGPELEAEKENNFAGDGSDNKDDPGIGWRY
ncbi:hypothetical protein [Sutcliffiella horikoshii]|uniref:hypothetical protein n=1 Tax=Sutcliffiella horikoshii TaxID=79883 RepID=UPI003CF6AA78